MKTLSWHHIYCYATNVNNIILRFTSFYFVSPFQGCSRMGGVGEMQKISPSLKPVIHILQWWNLAHFYIT